VSVISVLTGNQLFEACQLFLPIWLEDLVQSWSGSFKYAAVCISIPLSQCSPQSAASYGRPLHATGW